MNRFIKIAVLSVIGMFLFVWAVQDVPKEKKAVKVEEKQEKIINKLDSIIIKIDSVKNK